MIYSLSLSIYIYIYIHTLTLILISLSLSLSGQRPTPAKPTRYSRWHHQRSVGTNRIEHIFLSRSDIGNMVQSSSTCSGVSFGKKLPLKAADKQRGLSRTPQIDTDWWVNSFGDTDEGEAPEKPSNVGCSAKGPKNVTNDEGSRRLLEGCRAFWLPFIVWTGHTHAHAQDSLYSIFV